MKERYHLSLTKTEAKHLFKTMLLVEDTKLKLSKSFWDRHEVVIKKIQNIIYDSKKVYNNSKGG